MATGGEVPGQTPGRAGSEDLDKLKCQPCLEDGQLRKAVGMCVQCDDYLCENCYRGHTLPKPSRNHQLLDIGEMRQGQIRASMKDSCTEKCQVHDDEITKYFCTKHRKFGCTLCVTSDHKTCEKVHFIPHVAKELANNDQFIQAEKRLKSTLDTFKKYSENITQNCGELETSCAGAVRSIKKFRKSVDEALGKMETELIEKVEAIKTEEMRELSEISDKYDAAQEELQAVWTKIEALLDSQQNCSAYINMMKVQEKMDEFDSLIEQPIKEDSTKKRKINFSPNQDTLDKLKLSDVFGTVAGSAREKLNQMKPEEDRNVKSSSDTERKEPLATQQTLHKKALSERNRIKRLIHTQDVDVKTGTDNDTCYISGLLCLPNDGLVLTDRRNNSIKYLDVQSGQILSHKKLSSEPWDVTAISRNKVAVTLPSEKRVVFIMLYDSGFYTDRNLDVGGKCYGVDYRNDKLALSFIDPNKVQIRRLNGSVLHWLSVDKLGEQLFDTPYYLTYGQEDTILYVSNFGKDNVVCVKLDGTVVAKYTNGGYEEWDPHQPVLDNNGDLLVCAGNEHNSMHHITGECLKLRDLLTSADGLDNPHSICFNAKNDTIFVGRYKRDSVKVYKVQRESD